MTRSSSRSTGACATGSRSGSTTPITLRDIAKVAPRYDHDAAGNLTVRSDQGALQGLLQDQLQPRHLMKATGLWQLPGIKSTDGVKRALGWVLNDWQLSGVWTGATGTPYAASFTYQNGGGSVNLTGSPDFGSRIRIVGDTGGGCSNNQYRAVHNLGFPGSVGRQHGPRIAEQLPDRLLRQRAGSVAST